MSNTENKIINAYKTHIKRTELKDELYKWELAQKHKGLPNLKASNFGDEIRAMEYKNLIYHNGITVIRNLAKERPNELKSCFEQLFDSKIDLQERVTNFNKKTLGLFISIDPENAKLSHVQDERSIATYLAYYDADTYPFYKNSFYTKYCKYIGVKHQQAPHCYVHYKALLDDLIDNYIRKDSELLSLKKQYIPGDFHPDNGHYILAQDILFEYFGRLEDEVSYWIFQGNPDIYDITGAIQNGHLTNWSVKAHKDKIFEGDKVIIWATGKAGGVYALAEVTSEVYEGTNSEQEQSYYVNGDKNESTTRVDITITHDLTHTPIVKGDIDKHKKLSKMKVGSQGTNFSAEKDEYEILKQIAEMGGKINYWIYAPGDNARLWDEFYDAGIMGLGWDELGDISQYKSKDEVVSALQTIYDTKGSKKNDATANWDFLSSIKEGDIIIPKKGKKEYLGYGIVTSAYYYDENRNEYQKSRKVNWVKKGVWEEEDQNIVLKTLTDITKYPDYVKRLKELIGIGERTPEKQDNQTEMPLNTILYGPPGTGKTYTLSKKYFPKYISSETNLSLNQYTDSIIKGTTWWQAIAMVLLELRTAKVTEIINHPWMQIKARHSTSKNIRAAIWAHLQIHTVMDSTTVAYQNRSGPFIFDKMKNSEWEIYPDTVEEDAPEVLEMINKIKNFKAQPDKEIKRYVFTTFHQSFSYEDFIEGIKPIMDEEDQDGQIKYEIKSGVFKQLCTDARNDKENRYAIFIDEINRGNVSAIFGELITLIEQDKREGEANEMTATLPYSKEEFSVPSNVDIYGTMNTADRSVEALDSALRRRFSFEELRPIPELLAELDDNARDIEGVNLVELLKTINERIELVLDKDHQIGHSYFIGVESIASLKEVFTNKVFPLLEEYFFGDFGKIGLIVGGEFIKHLEDKNKPKLASNFNYDDVNFFSEKKIYTYTDKENWTSKAFQSIYSQEV